jgi:hypothetical protein
VGVDVGVTSSRELSHGLTIIGPAYTRVEQMSFKLIAETAGGEQAWVNFYMFATDGGKLQKARKLNVRTLFAPFV